jgi:Transglycosylase SLT domain
VAGLLGGARAVRKLALLLIPLVAACTPAELRHWKHEYRLGDRQAAIAYVERTDPHCGARCLHIMREERPTIRRGWGLCRQWMGLALDSGWPVRQWETMNWVMYRESRCSPSAHNPSGATGLMQIMPFWAPHCGGSSGDLYDPGFNLRCARYVWRQQGWFAWSVTH